GKPIAAWFLSIGHNAALRHLRARRRSAAMQDMAADSPDLDGHIQERGTEEALRLALASLPSLQRLVLLLRFGEGLDHERVSHLVGKTPANVRVIQFRALRTMRKLLIASGFEAVGCVSEAAPNNAAREGRGYIAAGSRPKGLWS